MDLKSCLSIVSRVIAIPVLTVLIVNQSVFSKADEQKPKLSLRPVTVKNVAFSSSGNYFAIPNFVTTGSVGVFTVSPSGSTTEIPSRFSEKDFYRSRGVFYYAGKKDTLTEMVFIPLAEFAKGYSVSFANKRDTLAVCGGDKLIIYSMQNFSILKTIDFKGVTRAVFSNDNNMIAAVADGKIYVLKAPDFNAALTIEPENGCRFADMSFSSDDRFLATYEHKNLTLDYTARLRLFTTDNGNEDRRFPWFTEKLSTEPGNHFPLVSYMPTDSAIAVTLEKPMFGKVLVVKSVDGALVRELKGSCHAVSIGGSMIAAGSAVYNISNWDKIATITNASLSMSFASDVPMLIVSTLDKVIRYKITLENAP